MSRGRKSIPAESRLVKTGITITPRMLSELDMLARATSSSRSAVIVALLEDRLHDVVDSFNEASFLAKQHPEEGMQLDAIALDFLKRIAVVHHKVDGFVFVSFPSADEVPK